MTMCIRNKDDANHLMKNDGKRHRFYFKYWQTWHRLSLHHGNKTCDAQIVHNHTVDICTRVQNYIQSYCNVK